MTLQTLSDLELIEQRQKAAMAIEELDAARKTIDQELIFRLKEQNKKGKVVEKYGITQVTRRDFNSVKIEVARELGVTKQVEKIDTTACAKLYEAGVNIEVMKEYTYLKVTEMGQE